MTTCDSCNGKGTIWASDTYGMWEGEPSHYEDVTCPVCGGSGDSDNPSKQEDPDELPF